MSLRAPQIYLHARELFRMMSSLVCLSEYTCAAGVRVQASSVIVILSLSCPYLEQDAAQRPSGAALLKHMHSDYVCTARGCLMEAVEDARRVHNSAAPEPATVPAPVSSVETARA